MRVADAEADAKLLLDLNIETHGASVQERGRYDPRERLSSVPRSPRVES
jgi:hypothetical protein